MYSMISELKVVSHELIGELKVVSHELTFEQQVQIVIFFSPPNA